MTSSQSSQSQSQSSQSQSQSSHMMNINDLKELRSLPGNTRCIDCDRNKPDWASVTLGIFICLECSGQHRSLGTHISFVRSVRMDSWTDKQIKRMKISGGNNACRDFLEKHGIDTTVSLININNNNKTSTSTSISNKYRTPQGQLYQQILNARMDGQPEPTELPKEEVDIVVTTTNNNNNNNDDVNGKNKSNNNKDNEKKDYNAIRSSSSSNATTSNATSSSQVGSAVKIMEGFGSAPHPSEMNDNNNNNKPKRAKKIIMNVSMAIGRFKNNAINAAAAAANNNNNRNRNGSTGGGSGSSGLSGKL